MKCIDNEIPKHKKKSIKKSPQKCKHKHISKECLLTSGKNIVRAEYCTICGKILNKYYSESIPSENRCCRMMSDEEIKEKYKYLDTFIIDDAFRIKFLKVDIIKTEREFIFNKEKTIEIGNLFDYKKVKEYMLSHNVDEYNARCSLAENLFEEIENELICEEVKERLGNDDGRRYSLEEIKKMIL